MRAIKLMLKVERDKTVTVKSVPFKPGTNVEVIILPAGGEDIFASIDAVVKKKKIGRITMKEIEKIVHEVRGVHETGSGI